MFSAMMIETNKNVVVNKPNSSAGKCTLIHTLVKAIIEQSYVDALSD